MTPEKFSATLEINFALSALEVAKEERRRAREARPPKPSKAALLEAQKKLRLTKLQLANDIQAVNEEKEKYQQAQEAYAASNELPPLTCHIDKLKAALEAVYPMGERFRTSNYGMKFDGSVIGYDVEHARVMLKSVWNDTIITKPYTKLEPLTEKQKYTLDHPEEALQPKIPGGS